VCNFDAIEMSHEHEMSAYQRNGARVDLPSLLEIGKKFQRETDWVPPSKRAKPQKGSGAAPKAGAAVASAMEDS
jgi:formate hydrogenlyase subunit 6/NADH:ubiquinone oxidoreductase subunit I